MPKKEECPLSLVPFPSGQPSSSLSRDLPRPCQVSWRLSEARSLRDVLADALDLGDRVCSTETGRPTEGIAVQLRGALADSLYELERLLRALDRDPGATEGTPRT